ncbi:D-alanyl-D-alanine carboxypeptidase/D-alanyl-D-alanine endopeptidase [Phytoactinopolyspora halotolerans]|uniref:D-alanyl-D-alanine carboxypeptidase/D-alanyl-D-alanine-endopeptidase n=1 Tax=Phytoactinopolyspora halotolerans TaxID=1981512 RepID=A0A6L9S2W3_9ACTN|nr:D-alanyl-D-alanine carboxypeptidase/D-alanyl-D-alanine-endopeptidase [Phytoactinopolyspora halotolerans]NED99388.1 D-alanyl-D-alanine carboxypeptidase/D-alanyl-D-alanine-endopeptidase [Phytoactinopolyspora halotolerans]
MTGRGRRGLRTVALAMAGVIAAAGLAVGGLFAAGVLPPSQAVGKAAGAVPEATAPAPWEPAGTVLDAGAEVSEAGQASAATGALPDVLGGLAGAAELGGRVGVSVANLDTGEDVYQSNPTGALTPASTMKLLTSAAVLHVLGPDHTFTTEAVTATPLEQGDVELTLVGGGDPLLASTRDATRIGGATSLQALTSRTARALQDAGVTSVQLSFDDGVFSGPPIDPDWRPSYVPDGVAGPVSALAVDGAREVPGLRERSDYPALAAAERFAEMLEEEGVSVTGDVERVTAHPDSEPVASVESPALASIVAHTLRTSDNDAAEVLARHVALGLDRPATSAEASEAVTEVLGELGVDLDGIEIRDGSGLSRGSTVTASALVSVLVMAADPERPELRPVISGLPVAGFNGTLADRAPDGSAGYVRAKTGTLTGVHSLAGIAVAVDGTTYAFAILADDADDALGARAALDEFAAALSREAE